MKVPVVLPVAHVSIDSAGALAIDVDGEPYDSGRILCRGDLRLVLDEITSEHQSPVRVEVREADGTTYADIATPPVEHPAGPPVEPSDAADPRPVATHSLPGISGNGFRPGERVAFAYVLLHEIADADGSAVVHLPPSVTSGRRSSVVLFGLDSHVTALVEASP